MPRVRDLLYRLRPSGAPGAANPPGVPADRAREAADELAPVFALLEPVEDECRRIVAAAQRDADAQRVHDREVARDLVVSARARVPLEREAARAQARLSTEEQVAAAADRGKASAEQVRRRSEERLPHYVDVVVGRVWDLLGPPVEAAGDGPPTLSRDAGAPGDGAPPPGLPHDAGVGP